MNKYRAKKQEYKGDLYMSQGEANYAWELNMRIKAKQIKEYKRQFKLSLDVNGVHICNYIVDFMVTMKDGSKELHEYKGYETDVWKLKWKLTEALFGKEYKMVVIK